MVSDQDIAKGVEFLLRHSDPNSITTVNGVVQQLEAQLGFDLSHKAGFIRDQIDLLLRSQPPPFLPPPPHKDHFALNQQQQQQQPYFPTTQSHHHFPPHFALHSHHEINFQQQQHHPPPPQSQPPASKGHVDAPKQRWDLFSCSIFGNCWFLCLFCCFIYWIGFEIL